jgi:hypothetical protein
MEAGVDWASRACWSVYSGDAPPYSYWSDCWSGLDGMFMNDGSTPQIVYWIHEAVVRMQSGVRLPTTSPAIRTNVLAARLDADEEIRILVGRHEQNFPRDVLLQLDGWPWPDAAVCVNAGRIPHFPELFADPPKAIPWPDGPVDTWSATLPVVGGTVEVPLDAFAVNDAWTVVLSRQPATHVAGALPPPALALEGTYPNPFSLRTEIHFSIPERAHVRLDVFDVTGRRVTCLLDESLAAARYAVAWRGEDTDGNRVPAGLYFVRLTSGQRTDTAKILRNP